MCSYVKKRVFLTYIDSRKFRNVLCKDRLRLASVLKFIRKNKVVSNMNWLFYAPKIFFLQTVHCEATVQHENIVHIRSHYSEILNEINSVRGKEQVHLPVVEPTVIFFIH